MKWQLLVVVLSAFMLAADTPKEDQAAQKKDVENLRGTWKGVSGEVDGNVLPEEFLKAVKLTFKGEKYTYEGGGEKETGTIVLDATKTPATIDLKIEEGNDKGKTQLGIYKVEKDTAKFCFAMAGSKERPKEFGSKEGSQNVYIVLKLEQQ